MKQLKERDGSVLIFVKTKFGAERLAAKLNKENQSADAIHGDLRQAKRERVIANFRKMKSRILVATDIAARGLDIPHIESVINYDLPQCPEDYIHRIGRTARAGASGIAVNLLTPKDASQWKAIYKLMHPSANADTKPAGGEDCPIDLTPLNAGQSLPKSKAKAKGKIRLSLMPRTRKPKAASNSDPKAKQLPQKRLTATAGQ